MVEYQKGRGSVYHQQFFTPYKTALRMAEIMQNQIFEEKATILDVCCGFGQLSIACSNTMPGVFIDTFDEACLHGNKLLENLESKFPLHRFPNGQNASKDRFSKTGGPFRTKMDLVTDMAYLTTPFNFFAKIETLKHLDIDQTIIEVVDSVKSYRAYKASIRDEPVF